MTQQQAVLAGNTLNGWDLEAMNSAVEDVRENPDAGRLTWRGRVRWDGGFGLDARTDSIEQLGARLPRRFTLRGDHPPELLGANTGPTAASPVFDTVVNPVEVATCVDRHPS